MIIDVIWAYKVKNKKCLMIWNMEVNRSYYRVCVISAIHIYSVQQINPSIAIQLLEYMSNGNYW